MTFPRLPAIRLSALALSGVLLSAGTAAAQTAVAPTAPQNPAAASQVEPCPEPVRLPPVGSAPLVKCWELRAHPVNETQIDFDTYDFYVQTQGSRASENVWIPYDEEVVKADFWNLWRTNFLENLWIEVRDEPYTNGVPGKHVIFHIEERSRVKAVDYLSTDAKQKADISKIEEELRKANVHLALDSFVDESTIRRVKGVVRGIYSDKGFNDVTIDTTTRAMPAGPKLVHLTFVIDPGPKYKIDDVIFEGNAAFSDGTLRSQMKENKPRAWWTFFTSGGTYIDSKFADDAIAVQEFYLNKGYARAIVGLPRIETVRDSDDGKTRWIRLRVPVQEGLRYRVGEFKIADNTVVRTEPLRGLFKLKEGDYYNYEEINKGIRKAQEVYGRLGFYQWNVAQLAVPRGYDPETGERIGDAEPPPIIDVTIRMIEGTRFYVNRIYLTGNTTTHDSVARREIRVFEGGVFDSEALKESVRRLNQLGYFKPIEGTEEELSVTPTPGVEGLVDIRLKVQEQNRNQISFGAGVSQFDGFFGQLNYQTSNFLGRGETFGVNLQRGSRARQYQLSFTEPYLFNRPLTAGIEVYARQFIFPFQFTQDAIGGNVVIGFPLSRNTRLYGGYGYEEIKVFDINEAYLDPLALLLNPLLRESLLLDSGGRRTVGKLTPRVVYNTVNQPIFPSNGEQITASVDIAGIGGSTEYVRTRVEGIVYRPLSERVSFGIRAEGQWVAPYGDTATLPIFEKFFLGGEYTVRGFDMRTIAPRDRFSGVATGGNKSLLLNAELYFNVAGPVRLVAFYDAGQVRDIGQPFQWWDEIVEVQTPGRGFIYDPFNPIFLTPEPFVPGTTILSRTPAFKTSAGLELRFFMPVLNVPFRLIAAYNPTRRGVLNNNLQPTSRFTFRFAVGTAF